MADGTRIEWTRGDDGTPGATWNPSTGCDRVSPGCDHCYALTLAKRLKAMGSPKYRNDGNPRTSGPGFGITEHDDALGIPLRWRTPRRVFVNSMSDLFHDDVSSVFIADVFAVMARTPQHTYQVLTKRHARMRSLVGGDLYDLVAVRLATVDDFGKVHDPKGLRWPLPNVWLGVSVEDQKWADIRVPALLDTAAAVHWLSCEPLLGPVVLADEWMAGAPHRRAWINWVVVGGESGPDARPMHPGWARSLRDQCDDFGTPFFFKQWGEYQPTAIFDAPTFASGRAFDTGHGRVAAEIRERSTKAFHPGQTRPLQAGDVNGYGVCLDADTFAIKVGKKAAGRILDGRTWDQYPQAVAHG